LSANLDLSYPASGCSAYVYNDTNPAPLPCASHSQRYPSQTTSPVPCACLLGLEKGNEISFFYLLSGQSYNFDIFYNERHTDASDLSFTTSLFLSCPYYDHCGVCQGNGQSCCKCTPPNPCFTTKCNVTGGDCIDTPIKCPDPIDACHTVSCNTLNGTCMSIEIVCNDDNECTSDSCDPANGCQFQTINCDGNKYILKNTETYEI
jgi:hypothetical protein